MGITPRPAIRSSQGAKLPTAASSLPGNPKIAAPIIPFSASRAAPQMPTSRRVATCPPPCAILLPGDQTRRERGMIGEDACRPGALEGEQRFEDQRVAFAGPGRRRGFDHRVLARHLVSEGG